MTSLLSAPVDVPPLGAQEPRISRVPSYTSSAGQEAVELAALAGLDLDPWQALVLSHSLGEREDGKWAAFEVGLVVARQNGKGSILEARELAGPILFGERLLIHSAHEQTTSSEHFLRLLQLFEEAEMTSRLQRPVRGKGSEAIVFRNGARILFKTRTSGGGRGLTADFVALDEAMILPEAAIAALVPTMATRSMTGSAQLWYTGSAVDQQKHDHGVVLARVRERALAGAPRLAYFEWSSVGERPDALSAEEREDPRNWAQANPGMGIRISPEHIANECAGALGPREFAVERLGVGDWPATDGSGDQVIATEAWLALADSASSIVGDLALAVDVTPDRAWASICAAGRREDGLPHLEVIEHRRGTGWLAARLKELDASHVPSAVIADLGGPVGSLAHEFDDVGLEITPVTAGEHAQACGMLFDAVDQGVLRHAGAPNLTASVKGAVKRPLGDAWAWSRKSSAGEFVFEVFAGT
jgi:hypothetical protein